MTDWKDNIYFILVEPKESGNIGASARAIKNMGFRNLCIVKPPPKLTDEAKWFACNALDVLESAQNFDSVAEAIRDKAIIAGTTRRTGKRRGIIMPVEPGTRRIAETATLNKVAVLFGRESRGLFNDEVEECGFLLSIPTSKEQPSLNLAQAVLIIAYELSKAGYALKDERVEKQDDRSFPLKEQLLRREVLVVHEDLTLLYNRISQALELLEYIPSGGRDLNTRIMQSFKHFIGRAGITDWELMMLHGICTQIEKKMKERHSCPQKTKLYNES